MSYLPEPPTLINNTREIEDLIGSRLHDVFVPPPSWIVPEFAEFDRRSAHQLISSVCFDGRSLWGNRRMTVDACPAEAHWTRFGMRELYTANHSLVRAGMNSLDVGYVRVIEHALAITVAMGLPIDWLLSHASFPFYRHGMLPVLYELLPLICPVGPAALFTTRYPLVVKFGNGAYAAVLPDDGRGKLWIDHEIDHKDVIGRQRMKARITPGLFAFLSQARTNAYGKRAAVALWLNRHLRLTHVPYMDLGLHNALIVLRDRLLNPNPEFDVDGVNREFIAHQVGLDKLGSLGVLGEHFVGTLVTFRTSHAQDLQAMREIRRILMPVKSKP